MYPQPITTNTNHLLMNVGLLNFYEEATSLREINHFLTQLMHHWDHVHQAFRVGPNLWYQPTEEDIYFITQLSRRGEDFPHFLDLPLTVAEEGHITYVQLYVNASIIDATKFQVASMMQEHLSPRSIL